MVRWTEEELAANNKEAKVIKKRLKVERKIMNPKPFVERHRHTPVTYEAVFDRDGRELSRCPACGAYWDDTATGADPARNVRQFVNGGVKHFVCFCKPFRVHMAYREDMK